ncbi:MULTISPECIES: universal stress protein [unclassified Crossiella]|uniref:universal stress protein n=1 Tax=unclassified Crossiella TaxID=2620835 RepID=UPI001FFF9F50|nr:MULTISPECIES: universal stress protein [unclassified Crossiella]MCK2236314.1 universal stress protein [Crossiella sp. S99.2]MCK2249981.1 universal stress protein [Crossiella sp. S99.1]
MAERLRESVDISGGVVVGVDGSASSLRALRVAVDEACLRELPLHVVRAWTLRTAPRPPDCPAGSVASVTEYSEWLRKQTAELVEAHIGKRADCQIEVHVVHSPSPQGLIAASNGADLLVVGHRGRGGFAGLVLGSVADQVVRHARCSVLVVRPNV